MKGVSIRQMNENITRQNAPVLALKLRLTQFKSLATKLGYSEERLNNLVQNIALSMCESKIFDLKNQADAKKLYDAQSLMDVELIKDLIYLLESPKKKAEIAYKRNNSLNNQMSTALHMLMEGDLDSHLGMIQDSLAKVLEYYYPSGASSHRKSIYQPMVNSICISFVFGRMIRGNLNSNIKGMVSELEWRLLIKISKAIARNMVGFDEGQLRGLQKCFEVYKKKFPSHFISYDH